MSEFHFDTPEKIGDEMSNVKTYFHFFFFSLDLDIVKKNFIW